MLTIAIAMLKVKVSTISIIRKKSLTTLLATIICIIAAATGRCVITGSHKELIELLVSLWDKGQLTLPGKNNINHLADFIFRYYDIRYENDPEESMSLESIRSETYFYHEPE